MSKLIASVRGTVRMSDGTRRDASLNTYREIVFSVDGSSSVTSETTRVEFELFVNANASGRRFRKATLSQAGTFVDNR